jgi:hypothetical protein
MKKLELLNHFIIANGYKSYLEIGTQYTYKNFDSIMVFDKVGIDPYPMTPTTHHVTSDEYFKNIANGRKFDLIFIDGLHHNEQVVKDVLNSLDHLNDNGTIVVHDCLPTTEIMQVREDHGGEWTGDVWKAIAFLRITRDDLDIEVLDMDYGCGVIRRGNSQKYIPESIDWTTWDYYQKHKAEMLNIKPPPTYFHTWAAK